VGFHKIDICKGWLILLPHPFIGRMSEAMTSLPPILCSLGIAHRKSLLVGATCFEEKSQLRSRGIMGGPCIKMLSVVAYLNGNENVKNRASADPDL